MSSHFRTPELELAAVTNDGWALEYVTKQTPELCLAAVRYNPKLLWNVNPEHHTREVLMVVLRSDPSLIDVVPLGTPKAILANLKGEIDALTPH